MVKLIVFVYFTLDPLNKVSLILDLPGRSVGSFVESPSVREEISLSPFGITMVSGYPLLWVSWDPDITGHTTFDLGTFLSRYQL